MTEVLTPDLCVIGAGAGGLAAAAAARALGASVVVIERDRPGGHGLHSGALPARALFAAAERAATIRSSAVFGIFPEEPKINARKTHDHVQQVIAALASRDSTAHLEALGADILHGEGRFIDPRTVSVGDIRVRARRFVIATGSHTLVPDVPGLFSVPFFTSETIFDNTRKLTHLVIIGAGAAGIQLAQTYRRLGSEVTVIESGKALGGSDPELAEIVLRRLRDEGVVIREESEIVAVQARSQGIGVIVRQAGQSETLDVSHILVASARRPSLESLDLGKARIRRSKTDPTALALTPDLRTSNRRVYAIGDAAGGPQLTHLAIHQAGLVVRSALLGISTSHDPHLVPRLTVTDPQIAEVGLTEAMARRRYRDGFRVLRVSYAENDWARATREGSGVAKLVVTTDGRILGAGIAGSGAGDLIALFAFALANRLSARHLARFVAPYPTGSELAQRLGAEFLLSRPANPWLLRLAALNRLLP